MPENASATIIQIGSLVKNMPNGDSSPADVQMMDAVADSRSFMMTHPSGNMIK